MAERLYTRSHEWIEFLDEDRARIGLTPYAAEQMGALVFVNLPEEGDELVAGEALGDAESIKAVSDIVSPVTATVSAVNEELLDQPALINQDPEAAWLVEVHEIQDRDELLSEAEYRSLCEA